MGDGGGGVIRVGTTGRNEVVACEQSEWMRRSEAGTLVHPIAQRHPPSPFPARYALQLPPLAFPQTFSKMSLCNEKQRAAGRSEVTDGGRRQQRTRHRSPERPHNTSGPPASALPQHDLMRQQRVVGSRRN